MTKSKVAVIRCRSYEEASVYEAVKKGVDLLGGINTFVKSGEKIILKPNVLVGSDPSKSVTTHPSVLKGVGRLFRKSELQFSTAIPLPSVVVNSTCAGPD